MTRRIVIAGAAGNIGSKLTAHFRALGWQLELLDRVGGTGITVCDMSTWDETWAARFERADAVVLLAGDRSPRADWSTLQSGNLDLPLNVFEAAARAQVRRVVFASSLWTMAGYRFSDCHLTTDLEPRPVTSYGMAKLAVERVARSFAARRNLSAICMRVGYCQGGDNLPGPHMAYGAWGQAMWLSNRDLVHGFECAVSAPDSLSFAVLNLLSANPGMRWDIEQTRRVIGYVAQDGFRPVVDGESEDRTRMAAAAFDMVTATERWLAQTRY